ncbi:MAG TPA: hypothetical protein VGL13_15360, partial [Polyangiaceae bacterium]
MGHRSGPALWIATLFLTALMLSAVAASATDESPTPAAPAETAAADASSGEGSTPPAPLPAGGPLDGLIGGGDPHAAVARVVAGTGPRALTILEALDEGHLSVDAAGKFYIVDDAGNLKQALDGSPAPKGVDAKSISADNSLRREADAELSELRLTSPDKSIRLTAAHEMALHPDDSAKELITRTLVNETDVKVQHELSVAEARLELHDKDAAVRKAAVETIGRWGSPSMKPDLDPLVAKNDDGTYAEPDAAVRRAAETASASLDGKATAIATAGNLLYGLSLASVLLFAALGLAITFGVMGVINMAHGEMVMIGAY